MTAEDRLLSYLDLIPENHTQLTQYEIVASGGKIIANGIMNNSAISISLTEFTNAGMSSAWHKHSSVETFILREGSPYVMELEGIGKLTVSKGKCVYVPANVAHRLHSTTGTCKSIIILIPGDDSFPKGVYDE